MGVRIPPGLLALVLIALSTGEGVWTMLAWYEQSVQFFRDVRSELRKVTFPTRKETLASTVVVLIAVFVISVYLGVVDFVLSIVISSILR